MIAQEQPAGGEAGVSLVEVIIYSALSALLLSVLGGLFYVGFQTQAAAAGRDAATGAAGVVSNSLQTGIRRASSISASATLLKARVAAGAASWQCVAWALTSDNKLMYKSSTAPITSTDYSTWTVLAVGASGRLGAGSAFTSAATQVTYSLAFTSGGVTVPVAGVVTANAFGAGSPESC
ncbi:MAG: hypothetical protein ACOH1Y_06200 [Propionicimonas sp.]